MATTFKAPGPSRVPSRRAGHQRAIAICDFNLGPFPRPSGAESGTDFGARFRHSNRTAAAQAWRAEIARMCRRGLEKSPFQAPLGPDSGTKTGAVFWHSKRCRFWRQFARFLARTAPRFRVPIGVVFGRAVRSIGSYTSGLRQPQVQALQGSLAQTSALCGGIARADRGEPSSS